MTTVLNTTKLTRIFIACDDFLQVLNTYQLAQGYSQELICQQMTESEMMAIVIFYHHSGMKCFRYYYECIIQGTLKSYFPTAYSYSRFVYLMGRLNFPLFAFLTACRLSLTTQGNYVDATKLVVCHNKRIATHRVFDGIAKRGKSSTGWFFGFKLHAVINQFGHLVVFRLTSGNIADNNSALLQKLTSRLEGFLYGDAGYISSLKETLSAPGLVLITKLRETMKPQDLLPEQRHYLRHRGLIESVFNLLKNHCDIEHSRHRSVKNFFINLWGGLLAYSFMDAFPTMPVFVPKLGKSDVGQIVLI